MDFLGMSRQSSPSMVSQVWSAFNKTVFMDQPGFKMHPTNALRRVKMGSRDINDVEAVLRGITRHSTLAGKDPRTFLTDEVMDIAKLHPGMRKLVSGGFKNEDMVTALREIDAILGGSPLEDFKFFGGEDRAGLFKGLHTKINARRFAQNDIGMMTQGVDRANNTSILGLSNIIGKEDPLTGYSKLQDIFYEEILQNIATSPRSRQALTEMMGGIKDDQVLAHVWANIS